MKTKRFCDLMERAMAEEYGESTFDTIPYLDEGAGEQKYCLGIFLLEGVHMATVTARAMYILWQDHMNDPLYSNEDAEIDEAMGDFCDIMGGMRIAPYMQWHCAYFPHLTAAQMHEPDEPVDADNTVAQSVINELKALALLEGSDLTNEINYATTHGDDITAYRANGMKISEIADTVRSLASFKEV